MEKKLNVTYSNFDPTTGISTVRIDTKIGIFTGTSTLAEIDRPYISNLAGCRLAELKATRKYYIALIKRLKLEARGMKQICDGIETSIKVTNNNYLTPAIRIAKKNYHKKLKEILMIEQKIKAITSYISYCIDTRDQYLEKQYGAKKDNQ